MGGNAHPIERRAIFKANRVFGNNLEATVRRGRSGKGKKWIDYYAQSDLRVFGIAGGWKRRRWGQGCGLRRSRRVGGGIWPREEKERLTRLDIARKIDRRA